MQYGNELYHYGIIGMRWGHHRYTNKYGVMTKAGAAKSKALEDEYNSLASTKTLTKKGLERKAKLAEEYKQLTGKSINAKKAVPKQIKDDDPVTTKRVEDMTNDELQAYNIRKNLENNYLTNLAKNTKVSDINMTELQKKKVQDMTNEELQAYNTRKQLESTYATFAPKKEISKGRKFAGLVGKHVIAPYAAKINKEIIMPKVIDMIKSLDKEAAKKAAEEAAKKASKALT